MKCLLLVLLPLGFTSEGPAPLFQDPAPAPEPEEQEPEGGNEDPGPPILTSNELDQILRTYATRHGGRETLQGIEQLGFELQVSRWEDGEEVKSGEPVRVDVLYRGGERRIVRLSYEEPKQGGGEAHRVVLASDGLDHTRAWVDGEAVDFQPQHEQARFQAGLLLPLLDLLYRPDADDVKGRVDGLRERDGVRYIGVHYEFHPERRLYEVFLSYYNERTGLVDRIDAFHSANLRRIRTTILEKYADHGGVKIPSRVVFQNRAKEPELAWTLEKVELNGERPVEFFEAP